MKQVKRVKEWKGRIYRIKADYEGPQDWWGYGGGDLWQRYFAEKSIFPIDEDYLWLPYSDFVDFIREASKIKGYRERGPEHAPHPFMISWDHDDEVERMRAAAVRFFEAEEKAFDAYAKELYERGE